jgi:hypothetical protein
MATSTQRALQFKIMLADDERGMVEALAVAAGLSASDIVRTQIREAYRKKFGDKKPKAKAKRVGKGEP